jgi:leucyl aminopeptidase
MKCDMAGGATVLGAMQAIAKLKVPQNVIGLIGLVENMPSGSSFKLGDVLTARSGKTIEVLNTDAEGRLVLADVLNVAVERGAKQIVDLATLTGACMVALGERIAGLMGNHQGWMDQVQAAADGVGEPVWQLPLPGYLRVKLDSDLADLKNITSTRYGGALAAGVFLQEFVGDGIPWAHLDIAGPADASEVDGEIVKGGTGFGVRTLVELLSAFSKPARSDG